MTKEKAIHGGGASIQNNSIDSKASVLSGYSLSTSAQTVVGAINEILPKVTGVGKVDSTSDGTGEIFNAYEGGTANVASGDYSHAEGSGTNATGSRSHAEGYNTTASGGCSHAEGSNTTARGMYSHAEGSNTNALNPYEHAEGEFNVSNTGATEDLQTRHSVGIGAYPSTRKNAHEIMVNGDHYIYGLGGYDGTNAISEDSKTLQEVINGKQDTLVSGTSIKTINGESLLGSGDIEITGGSPDLSDYQTKSDDTLNTTDKTVVGAINEIENRTLNLSTQYPSDGATLTVGTSKEPSTRIDFYSPKPAFELKGPSVIAFSNPSLKYRFALGDPRTTWTEYITLQNQTDDSLQTTNKTIAGAINEILPKATGVGKVDPNSDGTGEVFNIYEGDYANVSSGSYSHAEGWNTQTFSVSEHAEGSYNKSYSSEDSSVRVIHSVGIGSSTDRKNAHEIKFNGDHYIYGVGGFDGTNSADAQTLQTVITGLQTSINTIQSKQTVYTTVPTLTADYTIPANATMVEKIYMITIGATVYNVTGDPSIKWAGGVTPTASANSILVVSVLNNLATWQTFI